MICHNIEGRFSYLKQLCGGWMMIGMDIKKTFHHTKCTIHHSHRSFHQNVAFEKIPSIIFYYICYA